MSSPLMRAILIAAIGSLVMLAPVLGVGTVIAFGVIAIVALGIPDDTRVFDLFARPEEHEIGRLIGVSGFAGAIAGLAIVSSIEMLQFPTVSFVLAVLVVVGGNLGYAFMQTRVEKLAPIVLAAGVAGVALSLLGIGILERLSHLNHPNVVPLALFLAISGTLVAGIARNTFDYHEDPLVLLAVGGTLWLFVSLGVDVDTMTILAAIGVTTGLGGLAYVMETASITGTLAGVLFGFVTIAYGGFGWFIVMFSFFAVGGLATKYQYSDKTIRGVAEPDEGARGSRNVLGNSAVALVAVMGYQAVSGTGTLGTMFLLVFLGSMASALADTLASEIGALYDNPRMITTLRQVPPGTNGAVTWQGQLAGTVGAGIIAGFAFGTIPDVTGPIAAIVVVAGFVGMTADSFLGATLEGRYIGNQIVNTLGTGIGGVSGATLAVVVSLV